ncbi:MAG: hypothetical protein HYY23_21395 [Verrucomicrobia bacterium]|nr:hypothetical protein [Verrucomicrobiota bacterium]
MNLMRADMHKVICEEPRHGGGREKFGRRAQLVDDLFPKFESMRRPHRDRKCFGEHLSPLRRWLRSQVGRPWNLVYGEACGVIKPDSVVRNHIKTHLLEFVQRRTFLREGRVWCFTTGWRVSEMPVEQAASRWSPFYVHPCSGLLCEIAPTRRQLSWPEREAQQRAETCHWHGEETALLKLNGCWFECEMRPLPADESLKTYDSASRRMLNRREAEHRYGKPVFCLGKRQLSRAELKRFGLRNSSPSAN